MTFTPEQIKSLQAPLDPKNVKPPKKFGPKGDYIEGWHAIAEANRIFGFDGWSYSVELNKDDVTLGKDRDGNDQWQAAYTCICTVEVGSVTRQDVGFGSGFAKMIGDAIEGAVKEATTDALKRCLRTFGNPFGLALYDKDRANVCVPPPDLVNDGHLKAFRETMRKVGVSVEKACENLGVSELSEMTVTQYENAIAKMNAVLEEQSKKQKEAA